MKKLWILLALSIAVPSSSFAQNAVPQTVPPTAPADAGAGQTVLWETFDNNDRKWPLKPNTGGPEVQANIVAGSYQVTTGAKQTFSGLRGVRLDTDNAFSIALTVKSTANPTQEGSGLMFGASPQGNAFALLVTNDKKWALMQIENGKPKLLVPLTANRYLNGNGSNIISIKSAKNLWTIYLNGQAANTLPALPFYGAGIGILQTANQVNSFDDLRVQSWPAGVPHRVSLEEEKFLPAEPKPVSVKPAPTAEVSDRPFGTKAYTADSFNVMAMRVITAKADAGTLRYGEDFRFTGQQGPTSQSTFGLGVTYEMGDYDSLEAARDVAGAMLVAARTVFGDNSVYYATKSNDDLSENYYVSSTDAPRLQARTEVTSEGHFDGKVSVIFSFELYSADPKGDNDPAVQKNRPQPKLVNAATLPPRISLTEALKKIMADAPNKFAAITSKKSEYEYEPNLHIQGVRDELQFMMVVPPVAIYSIPTGSDFTQEGALKSVEALMPIIRTALGGGTMTTKEKDGGFESRFVNGKGPYIIVESSPNKIGKGFTQRISVWSQ